jgi:hypothetical protein
MRDRITEALGVARAVVKSAADAHWTQARLHERNGDDHTAELHEAAAMAVEGVGREVFATLDAALSAPVVTLEPDEDGDCRRCGLPWPDVRETEEPHECPPGFSTGRAPTPTAAPLENGRGAGTLGTGEARRLTRIRHALTTRPTVFVADDVAWLVGQLDELRARLATPPPPSTSKTSAKE